MLGSSLTYFGQIQAAVRKEDELHAQSSQSKKLGFPMKMKLGFPIGNENHPTWI